MSELSRFILHEWDYAREHRPTERAGQAAFNALHTFRPDLADAIRGTGCDPFYDDLNLRDFWHYVTEAMT
jgi:hypothetical protein